MAQTVDEPTPADSATASMSAAPVTAPTSPVTAPVGPAFEAHEALASEVTATGEKPGSSVVAISAVAAPVSPFAGWGRSRC